MAARETVRLAVEAYRREEEERKLRQRRAEGRKTRPTPRQEISTVHTPAPKPIAFEKLFTVPDTSVVEAEEFLDALAPKPEPEVFVPQPGEWFTSKFIYASRERKFIVTQLSNEQTVFIQDRDVVAPGQHVLCLPLNTEVLVRIKVAERGKKHPFVGIEARVEGEYANGTRETGMIEYWSESGTHGSIARDCEGRCSIFAKTEGTEDVHYFNPIDAVEFVVSWSDFKGAHIATRVNPIQGDNDGV
jgi:hypothetical protein